MYRRCSKHSYKFFDFFKKWEQTQNIVWFWAKTQVQSEWFFFNENKAWEEESDMQRKKPNSSPLRILFSDHFLFWMLLKSLI